MVGAPYGNIITDILRRPTLLIMLKVLIKHIIENLGNLFSGELVEILIRFQVLFLIAFSLYRGIQFFYSKAHRRASPYYEEMIIHSINLGFMFVLILLLYDFKDWRDFRVLSPHLLLSIILLILFKHYRLVIILLLSFILIFPFILPIYADWGRAHFSPYNEDISDYEITYIDQGIVYDENAVNGWCNTVLVHGVLLTTPEYLIALDDGLGVSWFSDVFELGRYPRSRYVMLPISFDIPLRWQLQNLVELPKASIYLNLNADCDTSD
jgi:hypothetical protein